MIGKKLIEYICRGHSARSALCAAILLAAALMLAPALVSCASASAQRDAQGQDLSQDPDGAKEIARQLTADDFFAPDRFEEISSGKSAATFKTSKPKCALYVNGEYHGLTPLKVAGLVPGNYAVQIKREGYKTVNITIQVKDGISDFYYIEMESDQEAAGSSGQESLSASASNDSGFPVTQPQNQ